MLIVDEKKNYSRSKKFDAKAAAILGFSIFGRNHQYLIKDGSIDYENLNKFLQKYSKQKFLIFGFTSLVYDQLINKLDKTKIRKTFFENSMIIHGGGWKNEKNKGI